MKHTFYYKPKAGLNTNAVLREVRNIDVLKELLIHYALLLQQASIDGYDGISAAEIKQWYTSPNEHLPKKSDGNIRLKGGYSPQSYQSTFEWLEGMLEKVSRQKGTDLSPRQCEGTEMVSKQLHVIFNTPLLEFKDIADKYYNPLPDFFETK